MVDLAGDPDRSLQHNRSAATDTHARASHDQPASVPVARYGDRAHSALVPSVTDQSGSRVASVDALRGFAMLFIIAGDGLAWALSDIAGDGQGPLRATAAFFSEQLRHVPWEGFHFYDFLFPLFVFVTGIAIVFSLSRMVEREGYGAAHLRILRRSLILFALGLFYYGGAGNVWPDVRLLGVLQRFALCYLFASLLFLYLDLRGLVIACAALLVGYWALMTFVPVPEIGAGSFAHEANLANWIDAQYLPGLRLYGNWDPEGLLSTLPAIATCLLGVLTGLYLKEARADPIQKALALIGAGVVMVVAGHVWGLHFPVIKNIWTSSFVLVAGGYSALLLGALYLVVDAWGQKAWAAIFLWFGANAITLYLFNNVAGFRLLADRLVGGDLGNFLDAQLTNGAGSLAKSLVGIALAVALAGFLYRRKIFLRV